MVAHYNNKTWLVFLIDLTGLLLYFVDNYNFSLDKGILLEKNIFKINNWW